MLTSVIHHDGKVGLVILLCADFFFKNFFKNTIRVTNSMDQDQAKHYVVPDLYICYLWDVIMWALMQQNLSSGFLTKRDSNESPQLQRLARILKFRS